MLDSSKIRTRKLYYEDAYKTEFSAQVVSANDGDVVLDRTLFFPEEGGQSADTGVLGGFRVADVKIKDGEIHHLLEDRSVSIKEGTEISGRIDWQHRFSNMQQHSGEHIFSGLVHSTYGFDNVGFHLSTEITTLDFDGELNTEQVRELEIKVNQAIHENLPVQVKFPTKNELGEIEYRSKIEIEGQVRIVEIPGIDRCACCAPHVRTTAEVGLLKIQSCDRHRGGCRLTIVCGMRALKDYQQKQESVGKVSAALSAKP
jgi:alanyl-tRNA synthetase